MRLGQFGELMPEHGFSRVKLDGRDPSRRRTAWRSHDRIVVVSGCELANLPGTEPPVPGPQWLVSVSRVSTATTRNRASDDDLRRVIEAFAMPAWDEDNHHPGIARHLWCPVEEEYRTACECKLDETLVTEPDGYQWSNPTNGDCRGCELARLTWGRTTCTIHG